MYTDVNKKINAYTMVFALVAVVFFPFVQIQDGILPTPSTQQNLNWWNSEWPCRKLLTINHTKVSADLINFPMLISLSSDTELAAAAQPNGQDIVFVKYDDNSTTLNHEIESYNNTNGNLVAWVNLISVSSTVDTKLWMYYGNALCGNQQQVEGTWDAYFLAVHHLEETMGIVYDSTSNNNDGTPFGDLNQTIEGMINGADFFDGVDDHITLPQVFINETHFTMEAWIYPQVGARYIISQRVTNASGVFIQMVDASRGSLQYYINGASDIISGFFLDTWYYVVLTYNGTTARFYVDGSFQKEMICTPPVWPLEGMYIGDRSIGGRAFHGILDEVRFSNSPRNSSWINTSYTNQNNPSAFYEIGVEEQYQYTLTISLDGHGTVTKDPNQPTYSYGTVVTLTATPDLGWSFSHWSGDASGTSPVITVTMTTDKSVTAHFTQDVYTLMVIVDPVSGGLVSVVPDPPYHYGDIVTLTASANPGYSFDHWSGDLTGNENPASLLIDGNKSVTASFVFDNNPPVAMNDTATVFENSTNNSIDVLKNDYDPDGDTLTITSVTQPLNGVSSQDGFFVYYTPNTSYIGPDLFEYTISDGQGGTASATVFITVTPLNTPPYTPHDPVPENGETNVSITIDLSWTGGDPDPDDIVTYDVYFGTTTSPPLVSKNQSETTYDPGVLTYETTYYWRVVSWDSQNASAEGGLWEFTTEKEEEEELYITITRPLENSFYLRNRRLFSLPRTTVLYGPLTITADVTANTSVHRVEFYIDGKLKNTDNTAPYTYRWAPLRCFKHTILVKAYDINGNTASDELTVFKWRLHPIIFIAGWIILTTPP